MPAGRVPSFRAAATAADAREDCLLGDCDADADDDEGGADDVLARYGFDVGTWELDVAAETLRISRRWAAQIGFEPHELSASADEWFERVPEADRRRLRLAIKVHADGLSSSFVAEYRMRHRDGRTRWMRARGRKGSTEAGVRLTGHQVDITHEKERMEMLQGSETRFRALVEHSPDAIAVHREGRIVYANPRFAALVGEARCSRLIDRLLVELVHGDDVQYVLADSVALWHQQVTSVPCRELRLARGDGESIPVELSSVRLEFDDAAAIFTIARDLTERHQLQAKLVESERLASLGVLAAGVAHEINNPLAYVNMNLETAVGELPALVEAIRAIESLLAAGADPRRALDELRATLRPETLAAINEGIRDAYEGSVRIQKIVKDLRYFSRVRDAEVSAVDLVEVLETALKMSGHELRFRARLVKNLGPLPLVAGDEGRLCQVLLNVLINAAQAIPEGNPASHTIRVETATVGGQAVIEISDTGRGVAPEHLPRIFEPFFSTKAVGSGTGLGLSICRPIIAAHGGVIEVSSKLGRGTTVLIRLPPLTEAGDAADDRSPRPDPTPAPARTPVPSPPVGRPRILVIDDEENIGRAIRHSLGREFEVETATSGTAALDFLDRDPDVDVILCDLMMPDMSGAEVCARACAQHPLSRRFVFMSGGATSPDLARFAATTENLVIDKPLEIHNLKRIIRGLLPGEPHGRVPRDRRRGPRYPARDIVGALDTHDQVRKVTVLEYSESGVRVAGLGPMPHPASDELVSLSLYTADKTERVQALVSLVREIPERSETCLQIVSMNEVSERIYGGWLRRAEQAHRHVAHARS